LLTLHHLFRTMHHLIPSNKERLMPLKLTMQKKALLGASLFFLLALSFLLWPVSPFCGETDPAAAAPQKKYQALEDQWGVRPASIRLTAKDYFVDFRYLITDPEKSKTVLARSKENQDIYLLAQKTGKKFPVPVTKVGPLRSNTVSPKKGRQYTILFSNLGKAIKKGDKVSVIIGKFKVQNLVVE
jgi:hypothetical protein